MMHLTLIAIAAIALLFACLVLLIRNWMLEERITAAGYEAEHLRMKTSHANLRRVGVSISLTKTQAELRNLRSTLAAIHAAQPHRDARTGRYVAAGMAGAENTAEAATAGCGP